MAIDQTASLEGDDAEQCGEHIANRLTFARKNGPGVLRSEIGPNDSHCEDHEQKEHEHLGCFKDKKFHRVSHVRTLAKSNSGVGQPMGSGGQVAINLPPDYR